MRDISFLSVFHRLKIDSCELDIPFCDSFLKELLAGVRGERGLSFFVKIKNAKLEAGQNELLAIALILLATAKGLKPKQRSQVRELFVLDDGIRLSFKTKAAQKAFNQLACAFEAAKARGNFIDCFEFFKNSLKDSDVAKIANFLLKEKIFTIVIESLAEPALAQDEPAPKPAITPAPKPSPTPAPKRAKQNSGFEPVEFIFKKLARFGCKGKKFKHSYFKKLFKKHSKFWLKPVGGLSRLDIFLLGFMQIADIFDYHKDDFSKASAMFKEHIGLLRQKELKRFSRHFLHLARVYFKLSKMDKKLYFYQHSKRVLALMAKQPSPQLVWLLLLVYDKFGKAKLERCACLLEKFLLFRVLGCKQGDNGLLFITLFEHIKNGLKPIPLLKKRLFLNKFMPMPSLPSVLKALDDMRDNFYARHILFSIELYLRACSKKRKSGLKARYTLEHILPQAYERHWGGELEDAQSLLYQIGNMTLLEHELNVAISNLGWLQKRTIMRLEREPLLINKSILGLSRYSSGHIAARTQWLKEMFVKIWG